jgi:hypothetical protein
MLASLLLTLAAQGAPALPAVISRYEADLGALDRLSPLDWTPQALARMERFHREALTGLPTALPFSQLGQADRVDYIMLRNRIEHELRGIEHERVRQAEVDPLLPFAPPLIALIEERMERRFAASELAAAALDDAAREVGRLRKEWDAVKPVVRPTVANRAAERCGELRDALSSWHRFYTEYDPTFTWWCAEPYARLNRALGEHEKLLREKVGGLKPDDDEQLIGDPLGRAALLDELAFEMIPYSPEELIVIAERELEWCRQRWLEAAAEMGHGEDRHAALEAVKEMHVPPGDQPKLIVELAEEAVAFLKEKNLVSIPELCEESWRMEMMSPERQKYTPFFTGGEVISIAFPTAGMEHGDKEMSLRGNNLPFCRATVHHELIPGHHLQGFMARRWNQHRRAFGTPFLGEGWALWWEIHLWDLGFFRTPADRVGALFWRSHRCARIIFSLKFHLGEWTPQQCVDFLVKEVGHEQRGAEAEVRRSIQGGYGPLYQCAYMVGGIQLRALHRELAGPRGLSDREFHDTVLQQNSMPIEMIRAIMKRQDLTPDYRSSWRFDEMH